MSTKRTPINCGKKTKITPEIIANYQYALEIIDDGDAAERWEKDGGRKREYLDVCGLLDRLLGRQPWEYTIFSADPDAENPPDWVKRNGDYRIKDWITVHDLGVAARD